MVRIASKKVTASSVIEVTVAMVIASISFVLAASFFWQVGYSSLYHRPVKAQQLAISLLSQTLSEEVYLTQPLEHEMYHVQRTVETYPSSPKLLLVKIEVFTADERLVAQAKQLVYVEAP